MIVNSSSPTAGGNVSRPSAGTALYCAPRAAALAALGLASAVRSTEPLKGLGPSGDDADAFCRAPRLRAAAMMSGAFPAARASPGPCVFDGPAGPRSRRAPREQPGTGRRLAPPPQSPTCCARACCGSCGGRSCFADAVSSRRRPAGRFGGPYPSLPAAALTDRVRGIASRELYSRNSRMRAKARHSASSGRSRIGSGCRCACLSRPQGGDARWCPRDRP